MANITRIKNNQITDSAITSTKLAAGTLVGSVFSSNLTLNSNVTIIGNLSITGNSAIVNATNTTVNDPLVVFNNGYVGTPSYDIGIIANRNLGSLAPYGSVNTAFVWKESEEAWVAIATTETGTTTGSINNTGWSNVKVGNLTAVSSSITGAATVGSTLSVTGATTLTTATTGGLQAVAIGNVTPGSSVFTTSVVNASVPTTGINTGALQVLNGGAYIAGNLWVGGNINFTPNAVSTITGNSAQFFGNAAGFGALYAGISSGFVYQPQTVLQNSTNFNGYAQVNHQNINAGSDATSDFVVTADNGTEDTYYLDMGITSSGYDNSTPTNALGTSVFPNDSYLYAQGKTGFAGGNLVVGTSIPDTVTRIIAGGVDSANVVAIVSGTKVAVVATTAATNSTSGALTVAGGAGIAGAVYAGSIQNTPIGSSTPNSGAFTTLTSTGTIIASGNIVAASGTASTNTTTGALVVTGGAGVSGAVYAGSLYDNGNRVLTSFSSTGAGNVTVSISNPGSSTVELTATGPGAAQWGGPTQLPFISTDAYGRVSAAGNIALNTVAVTNLGNTSEITANAAVGLTGLNLTTTGVSAGNYGSATVIPTIVVDNKGRVTSVTTNALSTTFTVNGTSGSTPVSSGSILTLSSTNGVDIAVGSTYANISTPQDIRATANPTFNNLTTASLQGVIGNVTPAAAAFTTGTFSSTLGVTGVTTLTTATVGGLQAVAIGNVTPGTGAFTGLTASTWANVTATTESTNATSGALIVAGGAGIAKNLNVGGNVVITGNLTVNGDVTTVNAATLDVEDLNITVAKGAANPAAANGAGLTVDGAAATLLYTSSTDTWNLNKGLVAPSASVTDSTDSSSTTSGALQVTGGVGIAKNLYVGGLLQAGTASFASINNTPIGNTTPSTGAFTTLSAQTETVGGLQAAAIGNVTPGTGDFTVLVSNFAHTAGLQAVAIGNVTPGTGAFTTATTGGLQAAAIGNVTPGTGAFTTLTSGSFQGVIGNAAPAAGTFTTLFANSASFASINNTPIGNATPSTGAFTSVTVGETSIGDGTVGTGTLTAGTGNLTYLNVGSNAAISGVTTMSTATAGGLQALAIGNVTPGTGAFTTVTTSSTIVASGNIVAAAATPSTSITTGALVVPNGGIGATGNLNVGSPGSVHALRGNVLIGFGTIADIENTPLTVNLNTATPPGHRGQIHLVPGDSKDGSIVIESFGVGYSASYTGRHTRGTLASPAAVQAGDQISSFHGIGYGATGFVDALVYEPSGLTIWAAENYTDTAQGTYLTLDVIPTGSNSAVTALKVASSGNVVIPATTPSIDYTNGALVVKGGAGFAGNIHVGGDVHALGSFNGSDVAITGRFNTTDATDTTAPGEGTFFTPGGVSIGGNAYVGKNLYIGPASFEKALTVPTIIAVDNGTMYAQMAIVNSAGSGSSDLAAYTANGTDAGGWVDVGIAGNTFSDSNYTITNSQDGYLFTRPTGSEAGGNLVLATSEAGSHNDIVLATGSFFANSEVARIHGNTSNSGTFVVKLPTPNTATANTGAFQVWGGTSVSGNLYTGGGAIVNGSQTAGYDFKAMGKNSTNLLWARPSAVYDQVIVGNTISAASLTTGAKLVINSTDSMLLPVGTTAQRPGSVGFSDVTGMFRYNTTIGGLEFYSGTSWSAVSSNFTVITDEQFNGDGVNAAFTLAAPATTAATIVSINGIVQIPTLAYSISGTTLTFTEIPMSGDVIDVRALVTTQTVSAIVSENSNMGFSVTNTTANVIAGTSSLQTVTYWDTSGAQVSNLPNVSVSTANVAGTIDTFSTSSYRTAKYVVQATNGSNFQSMEALVVHDGTTATIVPYGVVQTGSNLGILNATVSSGNVLVQFVPAISSTTVRISKDYLLI